MKKTILYTLLLTTLFAFKKGDNMPFPIISGTTLNGKNITLPENARGKFALIAVVRSIKAENDLVGWIDPVYNTLAGNIMYQANMYFIPMTGGIKGVSNDVVEKKLKESMDTVLYKYVLMYTGPVDTYVKDLHMKDKDLPYFYVVDPRGAVIYMTSGKYSEEKLTAITDKLSE